MEEYVHMTQMLPISACSTDVQTYVRTWVKKNVPDA